MTADSGTILIVEDDTNIADLCSMYLRREGYRPLIAGDGSRALDIYRTSKPCLLIVDIGLPGDIDGLELCRTVRATDDIPFILLTARDGEVDKIVGLEMGADDYITKPFSPREVVARVKAVLRRSVRSPAEQVRAIAAGAYAIEPSSRRVVDPDGREIQLTAKEFDLLVFLAQRKGSVLSRRQLLNGVWGNGWIGDERTVDVHIRQIRKKLGEDIPIQTIWGVGYRFG